jgi:hypothetical protein
MLFKINYALMRSFLRVIKWFFILIASALLLWVVACYAMYRIPAGLERKIFDGEVRYKFLELGFSNRQNFEGLLGNRIIRLKDNPPLYISTDDHSRLWPEDPFDMKEKGYTLRAKLIANNLLFSGFGLAEVISVERIEKEPIISK